MDLRQAISDENIPLAEKIIESRLEKKPNDIEMWIKLCLTELQFPFEDYLKSLYCIGEILKIDSQNAKAIILEASIKRNAYGFFEKEVLEKLKRIKVCNNKQKSIVLYFQAQYYHHTQKYLMEKELLKESILHYNEAVYPYMALGYLLFKEKNFLESKKSFENAAQNVVKIFGEETYDFTDFNNYVDEYITGVSMTAENYSELQKWIAKLL